MSWIKHWRSILTAVDINPGMAIFYENRAIIFLAKGMNDKAAEDYSQALKLTTDEARKSELLEKLSVISPKTSMGASDPAKQLPELSGPGFSLSTVDDKNPVQTKTAGPGRTP